MIYAEQHCMDADTVIALACETIYEITKHEKPDISPLSDSYHGFRTATREQRIAFMKKTRLGTLADEYVAMIADYNSSTVNQILRHSAIRKHINDADNVTYWIQPLE